MTTGHTLGRPDTSGHLGDSSGQSGTARWRLGHLVFLDIRSITPILQSESYAYILFAPHRLMIFSASVYFVGTDTPPSRVNVSFISPIWSKFARLIRGPPESKGVNFGFLFLSHRRPAQIPKNKGEDRPNSTDHPRRVSAAK